MKFFVYGYFAVGFILLILKPYMIPNIVQKIIKNKALQTAIVAVVYVILVVFSAYLVKLAR